jgi:small subunit ribosomal protein S4
MPRVKCKSCRRAGESLCGREKCAFKRRPYAPGQHGQRQQRGLSEFGRQLAMKQKIKRTYGILETQFRRHFEEAVRMHGITGDELLSRLERRLDNTVFRLGFASSRAQARQLVGHKMFEVNGKRQNIPSAAVRVGDVIRVKDTKKQKNYWKNLEETLKYKKDVPHWLVLDNEKLEGKVTGMPKREDIGVSVDAQMVVEYYSK